jgi:hypothetical protein
LQDHAKDAEFLNKPIAHYEHMQTIFGAGVATGRFAMGFNEPLGQAASTQETIDYDSEATAAPKDDGPSHRARPAKQDEKSNGKRKRMLSEDSLLLTRVTDVIWRLGAAVSEGNHSKAAPRIYDAVMGCTNFSRSDTMICLDYLMGHKGPAMVFVGMKLEDQELWCRTYL